MDSLRNMLRSDDFREYNSAMKELSSRPIDQAVEVLNELAIEPNDEFKARAIEGMAKISPGHGEALATRFLNDPKSDLHVVAIHILWQLRSGSAAPAIARLLATSPDELTRSWAAFSLGRLGDMSSLSVLATAADQDTGTDHEGRPIRETAKKSIERIRSRLSQESDLQS
jgi:hypothetical protein